MTSTLFLSRLVLSYHKETTVAHDLPQGAQSDVLRPARAGLYVLFTVLLFFVSTEQKTFFKR